MAGGQFIETGTNAGLGKATFVDRKQVQGELIGLAVAGGIGYHYFTVNLDGRQLASNYLAGILSGPAHGNNGLAVGLTFETSILIEIENSVASPQTVFWASYRLDGTPSEAEPGTATAEIGGIEHTYRTTETSRVLVGPVRSTRVLLAEDTWLPGEEITVRVEVQRPREERSRLAVPLRMRLAGRTRAFPIGDVEVTREGSAELAVSYTDLIERLPWRYRYLDAPAPYPVPLLAAFELVADLPGFANYPSVPF